MIYIVATNFLLRSIMSYTAIHARSLIVWQDKRNVCVGVLGKNGVLGKKPHEN